jgi:hypothetical protein
MDEDALQAIVGRLENKLRAGWRSAMRELKDGTSLRELEARIAANDLTALVDGVDQAIADVVADLAAGYVYAGQKAARAIDDSLTSGTFRFDLADEDAVAWMQDAATRIAQGLVEEQQATARRVVQLGRQRGLDDRAIAEDVRARIGLGPSQVDQVDRYRDVLARGDYARARSYELADGRYDAMLDRLGATGAPLGDARIEAMVARYRDNWIYFRGDAIALQQAQDASNAGIEEAFEQASARGLVDEDSYEKEWISVGDAKVRASHRHLHGAVVGGGEMFHGLDGDLEYPGDENAPDSETAGCRCSMRRRWIAPR